jgi:hypothetical protein
MRLFSLKIELYLIVRRIRYIISYIIVLPNTRLTTIRSHILKAK